MNWRRLLGRPQHEPDENDPAIEEAQEQVEDLKRRAEVVSQRLRRESFLIAVEHTYRNREGQR